MVRDNKGIGTANCKRYVATLVDAVTCEAEVKREDRPMRPAYLTSGPAVNFSRERPAP